MREDRQDALVLSVPVWVTLLLLISPVFPPLVLVIIAATIIGVIIYVWRER